MGRRVKVEISDIGTALTYKGALNGKVGDVRVIEFSSGEGEEKRFYTATLIAKKYKPSITPRDSEFRAEVLHEDVPVEWECINFEGVGVPCTI